MPLRSRDNLEEDCATLQANISEYEATPFRRLVANPNRFAFTYCSKNPVVVVAGFRLLVLERNPYI